MLGDQALERSRLVSGVVVHMHVRMGSEALVEEADDALQCRPLLVAIVRPNRGEAPVPIRYPM